MTTTTTTPAVQTVLNRGSKHRPSGSQVRAAAREIATLTDRGDWAMAEMKANDAANFWAPSREVALGWTVEVMAEAGRIFAAQAK